MASASFTRQRSAASVFENRRRGFFTAIRQILAYYRLGDVACRELTMDWYPLELLGSLVGIIAVLVLGYVVSNKKLKPPFKQPAEDLWKVFRAVFWVFVIVIFGCAAMVGINESGWIPRNREIPVYFPEHEWLSGEVQVCASFRDPKHEEMAELYCGTDSEHPHRMNVKFWGSIASNKNKAWKCERAEIITCRLQ